MAITAQIISVALRYTFLGELCQTLRTYETDGAAFLTATPEGVGEAWWNDIKGAWRGLAVNTGDITFDSVKVEEIGGGLEYGEYAIPTGERQGVRSSVGLGDFLPTYVAVGCRLSVSSRVTRPGQVRFPFLTEADNVSNSVQPGFLTLADALGAKYANPTTLGVPVPTGVLHPAVVRFTKTVPRAVDAFQRIGGYVLNATVTSQVSRRA